MINRTKNLQPEVELMPGHCIRRLQQIAVAAFLQETGEKLITPIQYAAIQKLHSSPEIDQRTLASLIGLDTSTTAGVIDRLESRKLVVRKFSPNDKRVRLLSLTKAGETLLANITPQVERAQEKILGPLNKKDQAEFMRLITILITENNSLSRAPSDL